MSLLDTGSLPDTAAEETAPSTRPVVTTRDAWRRARVPLALGLAIAVVAILRAVSTGSVGANTLDPDAAGTHGGRALATLLRNHGVDVRRVETPSDAPGTTVFVPLPDLVTLLQPGALDVASRATDLVVVAPEDDVLRALQVPARIAGEYDEGTVEPACAQPDAVVAGDVRLGGLAYAAPPGSTGCYAIDGDATFVELTVGGRHVTVLGSGAFMTNEFLDDHGDAALALRLLTRQQSVEWVYPRTLAADDSEQRGLTDLLPHRVFALVAELFVAVLLLALWRGRRLGPVVVEPLPVVVRAAEAVEGRARLYEAAGARERAANALRAGLRDRLVRVLGLAADASPQTMVAAVTSRTGRDAVVVTDLLYGPPPPDDAALVRLADELDRLDSEVRAL
jgi:hypothetical protein